MKKTEALNYFGGATNLANRLGISRQAIYQWPENDVPAKSQWQIAILSGYSLLPDSDLFPPGINENSFKKGLIFTDDRINTLVTLSNKIAQKGKGEILDALINVAEHNA